VKSTVSRQSARPEKGVSAETLPPENCLSRRGLLLAGSAAAALALEGSPSVTPSLRQANASVNSCLKAFIVSDAHLGWKNERQPSPDTQAAMVRRIHAYFPDLDLIIVTGDAHHNYATEEDLGRRTDMIAGECGRMRIAGGNRKEEREHGF
jgi:hypothetical protein